MQIGNNRVRVKPAGLIAFVLCLTAAGAVPAALWYGGYFGALPDSKYWKFEVNQGAAARIDGDTAFGTATSAAAPATKHSLAQPKQAKAITGNGLSYSLDGDKVLTVVVDEPGSTPGSVYLSNTVALDRIRHRKDLVFHFSARADHDMPISVVLREQDQAWQSARVPVGTTWEEHTVPVSFEQFESMQGTVGVQLGHQPGKIQLKGLRLTTTK